MDIVEAQEIRVDIPPTVLRSLSRDIVKNDGTSFYLRQLHVEDQNYSGVY